MPWWEKLRAVFHREATDARELLDDIEHDVNAALDERERELSATPEERLRATVADAARADAEFEELARRIGAAPDNQPGDNADREPESGTAPPD